MSTKNAEDERSNDLETTLCDDGRHVNVRNPRSGSGDVHTVELYDSGKVKSCTCKGWTYHETCYHVDHVRSSPLLQASARAVSTNKPVATDGGTDETETDETDDETKEETPASGVGFQTATGWGTSSYRPPENEEVDETPL